MITKEYIQQEFEDCLNKCIEKIPVEKWEHMPKNVSLYQSKRAYGCANQWGEVKINEAFLETEAFDQLKSTMIHEICHLIVGLKNGHNRLFKRTLSVLTHEYNFTMKGNQDILAKVFKYRLIAHSASGKVYNLGGRNRKTSKYLDYLPEITVLFKIGGDILERFEYVPFVAGEKYD